MEPWLGTYEVWALSSLCCATQSWPLHCAVCQSVSLQNREEDADLGKAFQKSVYENSKILVLIYAMLYLCNLVQVKFEYLEARSLVCQGEMYLGRLKSCQTRGTA